MAPPLIWHGQGEARNLTLLASVHALSDPSLPHAVEQVFERAEGIVFEANTREVDSSLGLLPEELSLLSLLSAETQRLVLQCAENFNLDMAVLDRLSIPTCSFCFTERATLRAGFNFSSGVDHQLREKADCSDRNIDYLEPPETVPLLLRRLPLLVQERWLMHGMLHLPTLAARLRSMEDAWRVGDLGGVAKAMLIEHASQNFPEIAEAIGATRNRRWVDCLVSSMPFNRPILVVAGASHFLEPSGLLGLLAERGYWFKRRVEDAS